MSGLYAAGKDAFLGGDLDWAVDDFRVILIDTADYVVDLAAHQDLADVAAAARVGTSGTLTTSHAGGVADANDITIAGVAGDTVEALIIYYHTGVEGTSTLIAYIDGLSLTPNGGDVTVQWDDGANKIFAL